MLEIRRREFIAGVCGAAAAWPLAAIAQQGDRVRRIGWLGSLDENDPLARPGLSAFTQALAGLGWTDGRNARMEPRWGRGDINRIRVLAHELVALQPDIIVAGGSTVTVALQRETRMIPIVFANLADPVALRIVARLDRPSGNITGFAGFEPTLGGKWLELLSEIAPGLKRAAIMFNPDARPGSGAADRRRRTQDRDDSRGAPPITRIILPTCRAHYPGGSNGCGRRWPSGRRANCDHTLMVDAR
jgi:putative ABC transport system substrate-binding protein